MEATGRVRDGSGGSSHGAVDPDSDVEEYDAGDDADDGGGGRRNGGGGAGRAAALAGGPPQLVSLDMWMLLLLLGGRKAKEADRVLRAKLSEGARAGLSPVATLHCLLNCRVADTPWPAFICQAGQPHPNASRICTQKGQPHHFAVPP